MISKSIDIGLKTELLKVESYGPKYKDVRLRM